MLLPSEKARLVLGYLEEEGPQEAYKSFLSFSKHLREFRSQIRNGLKPNIHHPTFRKLSDVLDEYYQINFLVQSIDVREECFNTIPDCKTLQEKVEVLINIAKTNSKLKERSEEISPHTFIKPSHIRKLDNLSERVNKDSKKNQYPTRTTATEANNLPGRRNFFNSTAYEDIPEESAFSDNSTGTFSIGNYSPPEKKLYSAKYNGTAGRKIFRRTACQNIYKQKIQKHDKNLKNQTIDISSEEDNANCERKDEDDSQYKVFSATLLEHPKMQESILENINKVILTQNKTQSNLNDSEKSGNIQSSVQDTKVLDLEAHLETIIQNIVEKNPAFDNFMEDVVGSFEDQQDDGKSGNKIKNTSVTPDNSTDISEDEEVRTKKAKYMDSFDSSDDESIISVPLKARLRSSHRKSSADPSTSKSSKKDMKNKDRSVECVKNRGNKEFNWSYENKSTFFKRKSDLQEEIPVKSSAIDSFEQNKVNHNTNKTAPERDILAMAIDDADVNDSMKKSAPNTSHERKENKVEIISNELLTNRLTYLPCSNPVPASGTLIDSCGTVCPDSNIFTGYFSVISAPTLAVGAENGNTEAVIGEEEIMNMPVMYLSENLTGGQTNEFNTNYVPVINGSLNAATRKNKPRYKRILPKPPAESITTTILPEAATTSVTTTSRINSVPNNSIQSYVPKTSNYSLQDDPGLVPVCNINVQIGVAETIKKSTATPTTNESDKKMIETKDKDTPNVSIPPNLKGQSMSTPRRRERHVRALSFNTPPKSDLSRKANTSPKTGNIRRIPKTEKKIDSISQNTESVSRNNLFAFLDNTQENSKPNNPSIGEDLNKLNAPIATRSPAPVLKGEWDKVQGMSLIVGETETPKKPDLSHNNQMNFDNVLNNTVIEKKIKGSNMSTTPKVVNRITTRGEARKKISEEENSKNSVKPGPDESTTNSKKKVRTYNKKSTSNSINNDKTVKSSRKILTEEEKAAEEWARIRNISKKSWDADLRHVASGGITETSSYFKAQKKRHRKITSSNKNSKAEDKSADITQINSSLEETMKQSKKIEEALNSSNNENVTPEEDCSSVSLDLNLSCNDEPDDPGIILFDIPIANPKLSFVDSKIVIREDVEEGDIKKTKKESKKKPPAASRKVLSEQQVKIVPENNTNNKLVKVTKDNQDELTEKKCEKETAKNKQELDTKLAAADSKLKDNILLVNEEINKEKCENVIQKKDNEIKLANTPDEDAAANDKNTKNEKSVEEIICKEQLNSTKSNISPELKASVSEISTAKKKVSPILETPFKYDPKSFPITPRFLMASQTQETPLTKIINAYKDQTSMGKYGIPTPDFPVTPKIVVTPKHVESDNKSQSSFANRATDYSSCSSYYKPDESEEINTKLDNMFNDANKNVALPNEPLTKDVDNQIPNEQESDVIKCHENSSELQEKSVSFNENLSKISAGSDTETDTSDSSSCSSSSEDSDSSDSSSDSSSCKDTPTPKNRQSKENIENENKVIDRQETNMKKVRTPKKKDQTKKQETPAKWFKEDLKQEKSVDKKSEDTSIQEAENKNPLIDKREVTTPIANSVKKVEENTLMNDNHETGTQIKEKSSIQNEKLKSEQTSANKEGISDAIVKNIAQRSWSNNNLKQTEKTVVEGVDNIQNNIEPSLSDTNSMNIVKDVAVDGKLSAILDAKRSRTISRLKNMIPERKKVNTRKESLKTTTTSKINSEKLRGFQITAAIEANTDGKVKDKIPEVDINAENVTGAEYRESLKTEKGKSNVKLSKPQVGSNRRKSLTPRKAVKRVLSTQNSNEVTSNDNAENGKRENVQKPLENNPKDSFILESKQLDDKKKEVTVPQNTVGQVVSEHSKKLPLVDSRISDGYPSLHLSSDEGAEESDLELESSLSIKKNGGKQINKFQEHLLNTGFDIENANKIEDTLNKSPLEEGELDDEDSNEAKFANNNETNKNNVSENKNKNAPTSSFNLNTKSPVNIKENKCPSNTLVNTNNCSNRNLSSKSIVEADNSLRSSIVTNKEISNQNLSNQNINIGTLLEQASVEDLNCVDRNANEDLNQPTPNLVADNCEPSGANSDDDDDDDDDIDFSYATYTEEDVICIQQGEIVIESQEPTIDEVDLSLYKVNAPTEDGMTRTLTVTTLDTLLEIEPVKNIEVRNPKENKFIKKSPLNQLFDELDEATVHSSSDNKRKATITTSTPLANLYEASPKHKNYKHYTHETKNQDYIKSTNEQKQTNNIDNNTKTNNVKTDDVRDGIGQSKTISDLKTTNNSKGHIQRRTSIDRRAKNVPKKSPSPAKITDDENTTKSEGSKSDTNTAQPVKRPRGRPRIKPIPVVPPKRANKKESPSSETKEIRTNDVEQKLSESETSGNKRKADDERDYSLNKKSKTNTQEFLKRKGVDKILDMLHGPAGK